jgi:TRAP-type C4-dicarboxylate transport system permease small subunit
MRRIAQQADRMFGLMIDGLGWVSGAVIAMMTLAISADVLLRAAGYRTLGWTLEVSEYGLLIVCFLGAPAVLRHGDHIRVDVVLRSVGPVWKGRLLIFSNTVAGLTCLFLTWFAAHEALVAFQRGAILFKEIEMPQWIVLSVMPLGMLLLTWEFFSRIMRRLWGIEVPGEGSAGVAL